MQFINVPQCPGFVFPGFIGGTYIVFFQELDFLDGNLPKSDGSFKTSAETYMLHVCMFLVVQMNPDL
jgi:hypothetical protein